jgi:hypothetical protein
MADADSTLAKDIVGKIATAAAEEAGSWVAGEILKKIFGSPSETIANELQQIIETQKQIEKDLDKVASLVVWETLQNERFQSATTIQYVFGKFQACANLPDGERQKAVQSLVTEVLEGNNPIGLALSRINALAIGAQVDQSGPGLIEMCMQRSLSELNDKRDSVFLIDIYDDCRTYLSALFHLQYQGAMLVYNAHLQNREPVEAQQALTTLHTNLQAQVKKIQDLTPKPMNFVAHMRATGQPLVTGIRPAAKKSDWLTYTPDGQNGMNLSLLEASGGPEQAFRLEAVDATARKFYILPVADSSGDVIYAREVHGGDDNWRGLDWWSGVNRKAQGQWIFLPSKDLGAMMLSNDGTLVWRFDGHFHHTFGKHAPDRISREDYEDDTASHFEFDKMHPPAMFP